MNPAASSASARAESDRQVSASRRPAFDIISHGPEGTRALGATLGRLLPRGSVVLLAGGIGAGKTTFVQGIARPLLPADDGVQSPTFTLVSEHRGTGVDGRPLRLYHMDLYRLAGEVETALAGFDDYLDDPDAITVIEWPERARGVMPEQYLLVELLPVADQKRSIRLTPVGEAAREVVRRFRAEVASGR